MNYHKKTNIGGKPIGMAINTTSHSYSLDQNRSGETSDDKKKKRRKKVSERGLEIPDHKFRVT